MSSTYSKSGCRFARATVTYIGKVIVEGQVQPVGVGAIHFLPQIKKGFFFFLIFYFFGIVGNY